MVDGLGKMSPPPTPATRPSQRSESLHVEIRGPEQLLAAIDELQARIHELEQSLERQERLATLGTIAGLIAHEFNNILTPILSYSQMALATPDDREMVVKALQKAAEGADRAGQIAGAILGLVRRDHAPVARGAAQRCDLSEALERALACLARPLAKDMIEFTTELAPKLTVAARGVAVEHVLLNLLINARSAMLPRGGQLAVRSTWNLPQLRSEMVTSWGGSDWPEEIKSQRTVSVEVRDSGRGMNADRLARLFSVASLSQVQTSTCARKSTETGDRRGHGLGMLVCKRLVEDAGGVMAVESEVGNGTRVWVVWPSADDAAAPNE